MVKAVAGRGAKGLLVAAELGEITADDGEVYLAGLSILTAASVLFDAVYVAGGEAAPGWLAEADAIELVRDAYKHCKPVAATGEGVQLLEAARIPVGGPDDPDPADDATIVAAKVTRRVTRRFTDVMAQHRLWSREPELHLPL